MRGFGAVEQAVQRAKERSSGSDSQFNVFTWKDGDKITLRFLDDLPYVVAFHEFTTCKDGKKRDFICPANLDPSEGFTQAECPICKSYTYTNRKGDVVPVYPSERTVGWAVQREVILQSGRVQEIVDKLYDVEVGGETKKLPWVGLVKQSNSNFWEYLMSFFARNGTITDRDYEITRSGKRSDTKYQPIPWDQKDGDIGDQTDIDKRYEEAKKVVTSPKEYIQRLSSLEYINSMILDHWHDEASGESRQTPSSQTSSPPEEEKTEFSSLSERLKSYSSE